MTAARPRAAHRGGHVVGGEAAAQERHRRARAAQRGAVARQQLGLLAEVLAREPQEVVDRALLAPRDAVAVVQEEDHGVAKLTSAGCREGRRRHPAPSAARALSRGRAGARSSRRPRRRAPKCSSSTTAPTRPRAPSPSATAPATCAHDAPRGLNAARNTALQATARRSSCFVDDDVEVRPGWLGALIAAAAAAPTSVGVFTGPIRARFEDHRFRACGREGPPITFLDLGPADRDCDHAWGANMAVRRSALERAGPFDEALELYGDEQEWQARLRPPAGASATSPAPRWTTAAPATTRACAPLCRAAYRARPGQPPLRRLQGHGPVAGARAARAGGLPAARPAAAA